MSLTATQRAILRDMADGARLRYSPQMGFTIGKTKSSARVLDFNECFGLGRAELIVKTRSIATVDYFTLTPAGAEAAREGAE